MNVTRQPEGCLILYDVWKCNGMVFVLFGCRGDHKQASKEKRVSHGVFFEKKNVTL